jgi:predicted AlkP superfamily phosphohydrolase/phosphomutase
MRAFAIPSNNMTGAIRINVKGRDPAGLVGPGAEYETLCRELTEALLALENAETGRPAVQWVRRADELYQGPRLSELPDLFVEWDHGAPIRTLRSPRIGTLTGVFGGRRTGDHWQGGWLVGRGPRFRAGQAEGDIRTQDIGPTVLEFFDLPAPRAYEGKSRLALLRRA